MARGDAVLTLLTKVDVKGVDKLDSIAGKMSAAGTKMTAGLTLPVVGIGIAITKMAIDAEADLAKLTSAFEGADGAAWTSVDALVKQSEALAAVTKFDDSAIQAAQSALLRFDGVTGPVFDAALANASDMAEALGIDLATASEKIGKALANPETAFRLLKEAGVELNSGLEDQIRLMVESGDIAGAQQLINEALADSYGGMAQAAGATTAGTLAQTWEDLGEAGEAIGTVILPIVTRFATFLGNLAGKLKELTPAQQGWIIGIGALVAAIGPALIVGAKLVSSFNTIKTAFTALKLVMAANPWALLIIAVIALVTLIVANWDTILKYLKIAWEWIKTAASAVGTWVRDKFKAAVDFLVGLFLNFTPLGLIIKHFDTLKTAVETVRAWIVSKFEAVMTFFRELPAKVGTFFSGLAETILRPFKTAFNAIAGLWNRTVGSLSFQIPGWVPGIGGKGFSFPKIPELAAGGIVSRPTLALIGERGPEAVVPLGARSQAAPAEVHLHLELGLATDPVEVGRAVVEAIRAYERSSGLAWRLGETG